MNQTEYKVRNRLIWILTVLMFSSFFILEVISWGKYVLLIATALIAVLNPYTFSTRKAKIKFGMFQVYLIAFAMFCFASAIWAWLPAKAIESGVTIIEIMVTFTFLYGYYVEKNDIGSLLLAIEWAAFVVSVYAIVYYGGFEAIKVASSESELRLENSFSNVNEMGLLAAIGCVLVVNDLYVKKRVTIHSLFVIPELAMVAATQSRKAFIILVVGVALISVLKNSEKGKLYSSLFKIFLIGLAVVVVFKVLPDLDMFNGLFRRFTEEGSFIDMLLSKDETLRSAYRRIGWEQFIKTPILGIGIGSSGEMLRLKAGHATYTHCNYVELLACGGLVGFIIYYSMYVFLGKEIWKYRELDKKYADICLVLIISMLICDYGVVTYSSKERYFYLMMLFVEISIMHKKKNGSPI